MDIFEPIDLPTDAYLLNSDLCLLLFIKSNSGLNLFEWLNKNKAILEKYLLKFGGVVFRNFDISSLSEFNQYAQIISPNLLDYTYRSTPRTRLGGKIYTSTQYPADRHIPQHNENSYTNSWPSKIMFFCAIAPESGGETPVASSHQVFKKIDPIIREKFKKYGVLYVRNYYNNIDLAWKEVFQTEKKDEVINYCKKYDIECHWNDHGPELTTKQICQASIFHPTTHQEVWFNQAHLFNILSLPKNDQDILLKEYGSENLPRNSYYGNGDIIEQSVIEHIQEVYKNQTIEFKWQKGDIMILDNILMTHGRNPFKGDRKIVVAMA